MEYRDDDVAGLLPANSVLNSTATDCPLRIDVSDAREARISVGGELDLSTIAPFRLALASCGGSGPASDVLVDMTEVTFFDSCALHALDDNARRLDQLGFKLVVHGLSAHQLRVLRLSRLDTLLDVA